MKILQLGKFYPILGGVEKVMYDLMIGLSERGVQCDMLCGSYYKKGEIRFLNKKAKLIVAPTLIKLAATMISPSMIWQLRKIAHEYDIIHVHHPDPMAALALFCSGYKGRVVLHWHSDILKQKVLLKFYMPLQRWLLKRAEVLVGTTPIYVKESPFLQDFQYKTSYVPIGVAKIGQVSDDMLNLRKQYKGKHIIFSLGRLVPYKGYEYLVEAAKYLDNNYIVLIGGSGPLKHRLQTQIDEEGVDDRVKLLGFVPDSELPMYFKECSVFCLPSVMKTEAFGIVQIEAMSCGKPVVATRIPHSGVAWVNEHGKSGLNVEPGNASELAEALRMITKDKETYEQFSVGALCRWQSMFTNKKMIDRVLEIYNSNGNKK